MKKINLFLLLFGMFYNGMCQTFPYEREWGTYTEFTKNTRAHAMDSEGNIYSVGFVTDTDVFPTTAASHQPIYGGGQADGFITKYSSDGNFLWGTYFGGEDFDVIEGIDIDNSNNIVVVGYTYSTTGIATSGAFQEQPTDRGGGAFIAKFTADGNQLWGTHFYNAATRPDDNEPFNFTTDFRSQQYIKAGVAINNADEIFIYLSDYVSHQTSDNITTLDAFQTDSYDAGTTISRFSPSGDRVWTTYYGINGSDITGIAVDDSGLYVAGTKEDFPTSPYVPNTYFDTFGEYEFSFSNIHDAFVSRLSLDGSTRLWSRYLGTSGVEFLGMSPLVLDETGLYIAGQSGGNTGGDTSGMATAGAYKETNGCGNGFLAKLNRSGEIDWLTYTLDWVEEAYEGSTISCGGSSVSHVYRIKSVFSAKDGVYFTGQTSMYVDIATEGAFMESLYGNTLYGQYDAFIMKFSTEGEREWGTYLGGEDDESIPWVFPFEDALYVAGRTSSSENIDTLESTYLEGSQGYINKFSPSNLSVAESATSPFAIYPNPANDVLYIKLNDNMQSYSSSFKVYNVVGQEVLNTKLHTTESNQKVDVSGLSSGVYIASLVYNNQVFTHKIIIE
ncbi:T9SS type A sorting domain-containing protein [Bizionia sp. M204]|uniref:T9SS type A sorting domain-containing protein n=1 Tax=unclassified Bizionia TaxID=2626393 RepID=UPI002058B009|nr:T9SS type A sorting domain-containing protein [Bizionia sp. M204]UPS92653.1 T9SS type A sorting domain-containing protein [Bizionia sp. M204]